MWSCQGGQVSLSCHHHGCMFNAVRRVVAARECPVNGGSCRVGGPHGLAFHRRGATGGDNDIYVMVNAYWGDLVFAIQGA